MSDYWLIIAVLASMLLFGLCIVCFLIYVEAKKTTRLRQQMTFLFELYCRHLLFSKWSSKRITPTAAIPNAVPIPLPDQAA